jgi:membrane protein
MKFLLHIARSFGQAIYDTVHHDGVEHAGYMAFISLLAFFPFLVFLTAILGFFGQSALGEQFVTLLFNSVPEHMVHALQPRVEEIISGPPQGLLTLAIIGAIWTSSSAIEGLRTILNRIYRVSTPPTYLWRRLLSILQFIVLTAIVILVMALWIVMPIFTDKFLDIVHLGSVIHPFWAYARYGVIIGLLFSGICWLYYVLPNASLRLRSVFPGAMLVLMGWIIAGAMLSKYLSNFRQVNLIYGSLEGIIVSLLFFYLINVIFIFGAEFNYLVHRRKH